MEIQKWLKYPVHCVKLLDSIQHARDIMETQRINQLAVVVGGQLVGILTDRDLRAAYPSVFDSPVLGSRKPPTSATDPKAVTVEMVMTTNVLTLTPHDSMVDAARLMRRERIGAVPIVDGNRLVGILTRSDVLDAFVALARSVAPDQYGSR
jgi:acetoin utilization protein AcuB